MNRVNIYHSDRFDVVSYGNGLSYAIHDNINHVSAFIQGDDVAEFRDELESWETMFPSVPYDEFYAEQIAIRQS
jgi:hypothetical protein